MSDLAGRTALVTGAARGIGREVAGQLAELGAQVLISGRDIDAVRGAERDLSSRGDVRALSFALDVADARAVARATTELRADRGGLDILVNNAAAYADWSENTSTTDLQGARQTFETNLFGTWQITSALLPLLVRSEHPRLVMVSSGAGSHGDEQFGLTQRDGSAAAYGISKAALNALTSSLAAELFDTGALVNAVCPGLTATFEGAEQMGARPVAEGAASVVWAAALPDDGPTGGFFRDGRPLPW